MNTPLKSKTAVLRATITRFGLCAAGFIFFSASRLCFGQAPSSTPSPLPTPVTHQHVTTDVAQPSETAPPPSKASAASLESLLGPIALYPDPILVQVLAASTYPLEIVQLKQWLDENKGLKGKALVDAVAAQDWDPSVQALAAFPGVVDKLANNIRWTTDLGNAFLAQESDVMDSVQTLRAKAQANGALKTNDKQTVGTETTNDGKEAITIESAKRDVVYVPSYNTQYVYRDSDSSGYSNSSGYSGYSGYSGDSGYSGYSDYAYSYVGYALAAAYGYYWGRYNWRDGYPETNYDNYYNRNWSNKADNWNNKINNWSNKANNWNGNSQRPTDGTGRWQHDPTHRGNAPYSNRNLANHFGQANNRFPGSAGSRPSDLAATNARNQLARANNLSRPGGERSAVPREFSPTHGAPNRVGNRAPSNWPNGSRGGGFGPRNGDFARAVSARGAHSMAPAGGFRGGPPGGFHGGPPAGLHGGPPAGLHGGGPPMGGPPMGGPGMGGPPMGGPPMGGPPMGGAPPPPPPPGP